MAQIPLGVIQVVSAIYLTIKTYNKLDYAKKHLSNYWIITIVELAILYLQNNYYQTSNDAIEWSLMMIFPMSIAIYFYIIMKKIVEQHEHIENYEINLKVKPN